MTTQTAGKTAEKKTVLIINRLGLHARAASKFVTLASSYESELTVEKDGKQVPGKSILKVMMLAAAQGSVLKLVATGPDVRRGARSTGGADRQPLRRRSMSLWLNGIGVSRGIAIGRGPEAVGRRSRNPPSMESPKPTSKPR